MILIRFSILFFLVLGSSYSLNALSEPSEQKSHMCYFSLNKIPKGTDGKKVVGANIKKTIERKTKGTIRVTEYYSNDGEPLRKAFKRMVKENNKTNRQCNGLVISGHHTGNYFGDKSRNLEELSLSFIEELSCDEDNKEFFNNITALWLHGSRTLNGKVKSNNTADKGTRKYIAKSEKAKSSAYNFAPEVIASANYSFSDTLNENTPFSSRYLRAFPSANVFGFSKKAPTEGQKILKNNSYWNDILNSIAEIGKVVQVNHEDKHKNAYNDKNKFVNGFNAIFSKDICNDAAEQWTKKVTKKPDTSRTYVKNTFNKILRQLGCDLTNAKKLLEENPNDTVSKRNMLKALDAISKFAKENEGYSDGAYHLLFNNLFESYKLAEKMSKIGDAEFFNKLKEKFGKNEQFKNALIKNIESKVTGSIRKIDYIKFYKDLYNDEEKIKSLVSNQIKEIEKLMANPKNTKWNKSFAIARIEQLRQYDFLAPDQIDKFLKHIPENNLINKGVRNKLIYSAYVESKTDTAKGNAMLAAVNKTQENGKIIVSEALRKSDFQAIRFVANKANKTVTLTLQDGIMDHIQFDSSKIQTQKLNFYMKQSKNNTRFQIAILDASWNLKNKKFLEQIKKDYPTLKNRAQERLDDINPPRTIDPSLKNKAQERSNKNKAQEHSNKNKAQERINKNKAQERSNKAQERINKDKVQKRIKNMGSPSNNGSRR